MPRTSYKKWRSIQDFGIRPGQVLPAWKENDPVEVIGTGLYGRIVRCTTLDYTMWEVELAGGLSKAADRAFRTPRYVTTHANNLRVPLEFDTRPHPDAGT